MVICLNYVENYVRDVFQVKDQTWSCSCLLYYWPGIEGIVTFSQCCSWESAPRPKSLVRHWYNQQVNETNNLVFEIEKSEIMQYEINRICELNISTIINRALFSHLKSGLNYFTLTFATIMLIWQKRLYAINRIYYSSLFV